MNKLLVANRGEIALRVMHTARKMGIKTVAVYSEVDRDAPHVIFADEAVMIGPAPAASSYLNTERVLAAATKTGADAIHPGYGFLSENADFAELVAAAGLIFIGPPPLAIRLMGSKLAAKETVKTYNIPMVAGTDRAITDLQEATKMALEIGFPVLVKASAGGGGKGMRIVQEKRELSNQLSRAISEAEAAFGDGSVFLEKYIPAARHIEIQILADAHGRVVHLFERDCSIQRRHQKVIEEAPSTLLSSEQRISMGKTAVQVAKSCGYIGAGTVEFLLDEQNNFYFLEMNTRLQVEHPVTECVTGLDLVEQQIRIARGENLSFTQADLSISGHAIELRIYAEDPLDNFTPSVGTLETYQLPTLPSVRVDNGYRQGMEIPIHYDPMIAKLITHASTREEAIALMRQAIDQFEVKGIKTTLAFGRFVFDHPQFLNGEFDTHFINKYYKPSLIKEAFSQEQYIAAKIGLKIFLQQQNKLKRVGKASSNWRKNRLEF